VSNLLSSGIAIAARSQLRRHPRMQRTVLRALSFGRSGEGYERSFRSATLESIRPGDCVWDVGANVGFYSELFAAAAGPSGKVISFEPSPSCVVLLEERRRDLATRAPWEIVPVALSDKDGEAWLSVIGGETAPSNHLAGRDEASTVQVRTARGDSLLAAGHQAPAVIKIDVEGFEGEVLDGMGSMLEIPALRTVCVEVHFGTLNERGKPHEPSRIVRSLQAHAFTVKWVDKSHFVAQR
jgi:FkbM family methyltransferase